MSNTITRRELSFEEVFSFRSGFIGEVKSYTTGQLTRLFGTPSRHVCDKSDRQWRVALAMDGNEVAIFTIYDWYGERWHIGGDRNSRKYFGQFTATLREMAKQS